MRLRFRFGCSEDGAVSGSSDECVVEVGLFIVEMERCEIDEYPERSEGMGVRRVKKVEIFSTLGWKFVVGVGSFFAGNGNLFSGKFRERW